MSDVIRPEKDPLRNEARLAALRADAEKNSIRRRQNAAESFEAPASHRLRFRRFKWIIRGLLFLAILIAALIFIPRIKEFFTPKVDLSMPDSLSGLMPDEKMGYNQIDFSNAILGETREKSSFVVLEQDVTVTSRVSQALANLALFEKSQIIRSYGTGVYSVDLSTLKPRDIVLDNELASVTISIPHATLSYITIDLEKTEFEETQKALFAFGEIKLNSEQTNLLEQNIENAMREQLTTESMLQKADAHALAQVRDLFAPIVQSVASEYIVLIEFASSSD